MHSIARRQSFVVVVAPLILTVGCLLSRSVAEENNQAEQRNPGVNIDYHFEPVTETFQVPGAKAYPMPDPVLRSDVRTAKTKNSHIYAGAGKRLWKSTDRGMTWTASELPFNSGGGFGILTDDTFILVYDEPKNAGTNIIRSTNYSNTWSKPFALDIRPYDFSGGGWSHVYQLPDGTAMVIVTLRHRDKYSNWSTPEGGIRDHIFRSTDDGHTWGDRTLLVRHVAETSILSLCGSNKMLAYIRHQRGSLPFDPSDLWKRTGAASKENTTVVKNGLIAESFYDGHTWKNLRLWGTFGTVPGEIIQVPDGRVAVI